MTGHVRSTIADGVMNVTLARPEKKNAITDAMYGALADGIEGAGSDPDVRVVLLSGEGPDFCAGNDIADFAAQNMAQGRDEPQVTRYLRALARMDKPLVAAVTGRAVGIGVTTLLHCDLVFVARDAKLSTPFVNLAVVPEAASSLLLPMAIGHRRAFALFALGETIDGETAAAWGLANRALDAGEVIGAASAAAAALAARPAGALALTKRLMRDAESLVARIEVETGHFAERLMSEEAREAFQAFFDRREPVFAKAANKPPGAA